MANKRVRLAVVGASRGAYLTGTMKYLEDRAELAAICDRNEEALGRWKESFPGVKRFDSFERMLEDPDIDAVLLATPMMMHAQQSVQALKAGKHVISEVTAAITLEQCWELVETVEQTGLTYMMSENYCYTRPNMMLNHMIRGGLFGDLTYMEGGYIHDCRQLMHDAHGNLTWRGEKGRQYNGNSYPTHSLGPVAQWLAAGDPTDELDMVTTFATRSASTNAYFKEVFGPDHPGASASFWKHGDSASTLIRTKKGAVITLRFDARSARPHNMTHYEIQGTKGAYLSPRYGGDEHLVWLAGHSPGRVPADADGREPEWESLWGHADRWEHPLWKSNLADAEQAGHGGGDFFVLREFADAILENRRPAIDVYDAVTWSAVFPLSMQSVEGGGAPVKFPDFKRGSVSGSGK